jgi:hypothetical protein
MSPNFNNFFCHLVKIWYFRETLEMSVYFRSYKGLFIKFTASVAQSSIEFSVAWIKIHLTDFSIDLKLLEVLSVRGARPCSINCVLNIGIIHDVSVTAQ